MNTVDTPITPDMTVNELLDACPRSAVVFVTRGMACVGCPLSRFHTLAEAAAIYDQDLPIFLSDLSIYRSVTRSTNGEPRGAIDS